MSPSPEKSPQVWADRSHPVQEDMKFQRATWRVERGGWIILGLLVGLALLGLFSNGPISSVTATNAAGTLQLDYGRFQRNGAAGTLQLRLAAGAGEEAVIRIGNSFVEVFNIESIIPEPVEQRGRPDGVEMTFKAAGDGPFLVHLAVRPETVGPVKSEIGTTGGTHVRFTQFVFP